jgi:hypothetical protein
MPYCATLYIVSPLSSELIVYVILTCNKIKLICNGFKVITAEETSEERKGDTLGLRREQYGVFTPRKSCNLETCSHDYATVDEVVFSPC